jgi:LysR family hydrogen peroxide-inducible transcriptional activator
MQQTEKYSDVFEEIKEALEHEDFWYLNDKNKTKLRSFEDTKPAREVSLIYPKNELKLHIINALRDVISGVVRGAIAFTDVEIISPKPNK